MIHLLKVSKFQNFRGKKKEEEEEEEEEEEAHRWINTSGLECFVLVYPKKKKKKKNRKEKRVLFIFYFFGDKCQVLSLGISLDDYTMSSD